MLNYLTLDEIKKQCVVDADFHEDDEYLEMVGEAAEDMTAQLLDSSLDELVAKYGDMPASVRHAMRMLCDFFYAINRGSAEENHSIPESVQLLLKLYRKY